MRRCSENAHILGNFMLNMQGSMVIRCRARFHNARVVRRSIAAKEISAACWMEAPTWSMHIDSPVSATFVLGFISEHHS